VWWARIRRCCGLGSGSTRHVSRHFVAGLLGGRSTNSPRTSAETPLAEIVAAFNAYQPEVVLGYPSLIALVAREQLGGRLRIARIVAYAGEVLTADVA
jgi:phenylacetate-CoA ligase